MHEFEVLQAIYRVSLWMCYVLLHACVVDFVQVFEFSLQLAFCLKNPANPYFNFGFGTTHVVSTPILL